MSSGLARSRAEMVVGLMLSLARKIGYADSALKEGKWLKGELMGVELRGKSLIVFGDPLRKDLEGPARAFEMKLLDSTPSTLRDADFIVVDDPSVRLDRSFLTGMKDGSYLVVSDAACEVDTIALKEALAEKLGGAALSQGASRMKIDGRGFNNLLLFDSVPTGRGGAQEFK